MKIFKGTTKNITLENDGVLIEPGSHWYSKFTIQKTTVRVPYDKIKTVEMIKASLMYQGFMVLIVGDSTSFTTGAITNHRAELVKNPYAIAFQKSQTKEIEEIKNSIIQSIAATKSTSNQQNHSLDDLIKLKELLEAGIITQQEFDEKKKALLDKI